MFQAGGVRRGSRCGPLLAEWSCFRWACSLTWNGSRGSVRRFWLPVLAHTCTRCGCTFDIVAERRTCTCSSCSRQRSGWSPAPAWNMGQQEHRPKLFGHADVTQTEPTEQTDYRVGQNHVTVDIKPVAAAVDDVHDPVAGRQYETTDSESQSHDWCSLTTHRERRDDIHYHQRDSQAGEEPSGLNEDLLLGTKAHRQQPRSSKPTQECCA